MVLCGAINVVFKLPYLDDQVKLARAYRPWRSLFIGNQMYDGLEHDGPPPAIIVE